MADAARDLGLAAKTGQGLRVGGKLARHDLDGDALVEAQLDRLVHGPHSTLAKQTSDAVRAFQDGPRQASRCLFRSAHLGVSSSRPIQLEVCLVIRHPREGRPKPVL